MLNSPLRSPLRPLLRAMRAGNSTPSVPSFYFNFSNPSNVTLGSAQARGNITSTQNAVIAASVSPSRTTGVAPLYVNFDATGTTSTLSTNPSHELFFAHDFGDAGAGTWANGVQSSGLTSKNAGYGPVTGHVYETPGTYTVQMVVTDGVNTATKTGTIVVQDPNTVYAGALTICISSSNNFTGTPSGATQVSTAGNTDMYAAYQSHKGTNKRLLFCKADSWTCTDAMLITHSGLYLGGYGTGSALSIGSGTGVSVVPGLGMTDAVFAITSGSPTDVRIHEFKISGSTNVDTKAFRTDVTCTQVLVSHVELRNTQRYAFEANPGASHGAVMDQICFYECWRSDMSGTPFVDGGPGPSNGAVGIYAALERGGIMGCYIDNNNYGEQTIRLPYLLKAHVNNNYIARPNQTKNVLKIHSFDYAVAALYSEKFVVFGNVLDLRGGYAYNGTTVTEVGDCYIVMGNGGVGSGERVRNAIIESNYTYGSRVQPKDLRFISVGCPNVTVRNNIADFELGDGVSSYSTTFGYPTAVFAYVGTSTPDPTINVQIYNNTLYTNGVIGDNTFVWLTGATTDYVTVQNNICYQPFAAVNQTQIVYNPDGVVHITASNNTTNKATQNPNFGALPPTTLAHWKPGVGSYAIDSGTTVPVLRDFNNISRYGATYDLGAVLP